MLFFRYYLWIAPQCLCAIAAGIAIKRRTYRSFPLFFIYLLITVLQFIVLLSISLFQQLTLYRWSLVMGLALSFLLELAVLYEVAGKLVFSHLSLARIFRPLPQRTTGGLVLVAAVLAAMLPEISVNRAMSVFQLLNFGLNLIAVGLLLAMLLLTRILGISWKGIPAGIALGFGITGTAEMAVSPLISQFGQSGYLRLDLIRMAAFHVSTVMWLVYILLGRDNSPRRDSGPPLPQLEIHVQDLQKIVQR